MDRTRSRARILPRSDAFLVARQQRKAGRKKSWGEGEGKGEKLERRTGIGKAVVAILAELGRAISEIGFLWRAVLLRHVDHALPHQTTSCLLSIVGRETDKDRARDVLPGRMFYRELALYRAFWIAASEAGLLIIQQALPISRRASHSLP
jgi:hypothetical protein